MQEKELVEEAIIASKMAYAPYSNFKVGAAILMKDGRVIHGCNVENAAYSLAICAERNAMTTMVQLGYKKGDVDMMAIVGDTKGPCAPCGSCRQVMVELVNSDAKIILANLHDNILITTVPELVPYSFTSEDLK